MYKCENCEKEYKTEKGLGKHVCYYECDENNCKEKFKSKENFKQHKANIHNIDVVWFKCKFKCKNDNDLQQHLFWIMWRTSA